MQIRGGVQVICPQQVYACYYPTNRLNATTRQSILQESKPPASQRPNLPNAVITTKMLLQLKRQLQHSRS